MPDATIPTTETGTRHRTAERVARSIDVPVLSVSAAMSVIAVYRNDVKHTIQPTGWLHDRTDQALATMQRFRSRFDVALGNLSILELEDTVSVGDVVGVIQAAEMVLRIAEEVDGYLVELGEDGRLVGLQSAELSDGVARALHLVVRDYCVLAGDGPTSWAAAVDAVVDELAGLPSDELRDPIRVAGILKLPGSFHDAESGVEPRGYRLLHRLPRFSDTIIERIVDRFVNLQQIMRASIVDLEEVDGVGQTRAHLVKDGLARLAEASIFERYQ
jgi:diadenylate cyclase